MTKTIYGFIGNLGVGKTYLAQKKTDELKSNGNPVTILSWADGIKQILSTNFGLNKSGYENEDWRVVNRNMGSAIIEMRLRRSIEDVFDKLFIDPIDDWPGDPFNQLWIKYGKEICECIKNCETDYALNHRRLCQLIGTEMGRGMNDRLWIEETLNRINILFNTDVVSNVIIDDIRFVNEFDSLENFCKQNRYIFVPIGITCRVEIRAIRRGLTIKEITELDKHQSESEIGSILEKMHPEEIVNNY